MQDRITIHQLTGKLVAELKRNGFSETTIWRCYMPCVGSIEHYYEKLGQILYDPAVTSEFVQIQKDRVKVGEIKNYRPYLLAAERLNEVYMTGMISVPQVVHGTKYTLNEENGKLLDRFLEWKQYGSNTRNDAIWAVRKYLFYFQQNGHESILDVTAEEARQFLLQAVTEVKLSTLHTLLLYLKYFHIFLLEHAISAPDCVDLFNYAVHTHLLPRNDERLFRLTDCSIHPGLHLHSHNLHVHIANCVLEKSIFQFALQCYSIQAIQCNRADMHADIHAISYLDTLATHSQHAYPDQSTLVYENDHTRQLSDFQDDN